VIVEAGLSPFRLLMLGTALELTIVLFEVPTGVVADTVSRRLSVIVGLALTGLGFAITGAITMLILLRTVEQSSWAMSVLLAIASVVAVVWLFGHLLGMPLPRGPWGF